MKRVHNILYNGKKIDFIWRNMLFAKMGIYWMISNRITYSSFSAHFLTQKGKIRSYF